MNSDTFVTMLPYLRIALGAFTWGTLVTTLLLVAERRRRPTPAVALATARQRRLLNPEEGR